MYTPEFRNFENIRKIRKITVFFYVVSQQYYETLICSASEQISKYINIKCLWYIEDSIQKISTRYMWIVL